MTATERLLAWARKQSCIYAKCFKRVVAMTEDGGLEFFCAEHAAELSTAITLIDLPLKQEVAA